MGKLAFPLDAELTGPDRVVLGILKKEYELHQNTCADATASSPEDSDDSGVKHSKFVTPSPEGMSSTYFSLFTLGARCTGLLLHVPHG